MKYLFTLYKKKKLHQSYLTVSPKNNLSHCFQIANQLIFTQQISAAMAGNY